MKKILSIILLACVALGFGLARADSDWDVDQQKLAYRQAFVSWVAENAHESLTPEKSMEIVDAATYYAQQQGLDPMLVLAVMRTESGFRAHAQGKGSKGLMQVQVYWHRDKLQGRSPFNPRVSIEVGTQILADCWAKVHGDMRRALRCYNGGGDRNYSVKVERQRRSLDRYAQQSVFDQFVARLTTVSPS